MLKLDLHGHDREAALAALDRFLNRAWTRGDSPLEIIVGQGEVLRPLVREYLENSPLVQAADWLPGNFGALRVHLDL